MRLFVPLCLCTYHLPSSWVRVRLHQSTGALRGAHPRADTTQCVAVKFLTATNAAPRAKAEKFVAVNPLPTRREEDPVTLALVKVPAGSMTVTCSCSFSCCLKF